jgi:hypothetical protein
MVKENIISWRDFHLMYSRSSLLKTQSMEEQHFVRRDEKESGTDIFFGKKSGF